MIKASDVALTGLMIAAAIWTFQIKREAELSSEKVAELQQKIDKEKDRIGIMQADWALLTQPGHLKGVMERFSDELQLQQLSVDQIVTPDELPPMRLPDSDPIGDMARSGTDQIVTGSIGEAGQ